MARKDVREMTLTDERIEAAAKAMGNAINEQVSIHRRMIIRTPHGCDIETTRAGLRAAAPFLQMPWEMPTDKECRELHALTDNEVGHALRQFVCDRNAALIPKPADPRREKVKTALIGEVSTFLWNTEEAYRAADRILAALDAKE
jgi:hypothetical protein